MDYISRPGLPCYHPAMLIRFFRLSDRLSHLLLKLVALPADLLPGTRQSLILWLDQHLRFGKRQAGGSASRVGFLSALLLLALGAVVMALLWNTGGSAGSPIIQLLTVGQAQPQVQPAAEALPAAAAPVQTWSGVGGTLAFAMPQGGQWDIFALQGGNAAPQRLTAHLADDRDPAWSPDGTRLAFASHRDGNWELYVMDLASGVPTRLTRNLAYEAAPSWSPDGQWLAFEAYYNGNLDIYIMRADASEGPYPVTRGPSTDHSPAWTTAPSGREIAYVSLREGQSDIYLISLDDPSEDRAINITRSPDRSETDPAWSPNGAGLAFSAEEEGLTLVYAYPDWRAGGQPTLIGQGREPAWSPDGAGLIFVADRLERNRLLTGQFGAWSASVQAIQLDTALSGPAWSGLDLPEPRLGELETAANSAVPPAYEEVITPQAGAAAPYLLFNLPGVIAESPYLSDRVDGSFAALRDRVGQAAGWDVLGRLDEVWWTLDRPVEPGQDFRSWHKAGRAFDLVQAYNQGAPPQIELVPETYGPSLYWRIYVRAAVQDGSLGEPLHHYPFDLEARVSGDPQAYEAGGALRPTIPAGYYVDFTSLAIQFGWLPVPADSTWRYNWPGIRYWEYIKPGDLAWWDAMLELYAQDEILPVFGAP